MLLSLPMALVLVSPELKSKLMFSYITVVPGCLQWSGDVYILYSCGKLSSQLKVEMGERFWEAFGVKTLFSSLIKALVQRFGYTVEQNIGYNKQHLNLMPKLKQLDSRKNIKIMELQDWILRKKFVVLCIPVESQRDWQDDFCVGASSPAVALQMQNPLQECCCSGRKWSPFLRAEADL